MGNWVRTTVGAIAAGDIEAVMMPMGHGYRTLDAVTIMPTADADEASRLLEAYVGRDPNVKYYRLGIGTETKDGKRWCEATAFLARVKP